MIVDTISEIVALITGITGQVYSLLQQGNELLANVRAGKVSDDELKAWKTKVTQASDNITSAQRALFGGKE